MKVSFAAIWVSIICLSTLCRSVAVAASSSSNAVRAGFDATNPILDRHNQRHYLAKHASKSTHGCKKRGDSEEDRKQKGKERKEEFKSESADCFGTTGSVAAPEKVHLKKPDICFRRLPKSLFRKNGKVYMMAHQDWYSQYRQHRGPHAVMRKLNLESPRRRKNRFAVTPTEESNRSGRDNIKDDDSEDDQHPSKDKSSTRKGEDIQALKKKPKVVGPPTPGSITHTGLIPKARSEACLNRARHGIWTHGLLLVIALIVASIF
ncbi:hypothetical protein EDD21DRAFT_383421 [Dissophora ornata]|nr:hypothetical protein BGZ58_000836 [Dissophora ornata]KAI8598122.1 hypothetical protein EDD21DRAFT_383421 [Dissophora ornata]